MLITVLLDGHFSVIQLIVLVGNIIILVQSLSPIPAAFSEKAQMNPVYTTCSAAHSRQRDKTSINQVTLQFFTLCLKCK